MTPRHDQLREERNEVARRRKKAQAAEMLWDLLLRTDEHKLGENTYARRAFNAILLAARELP